MKNRLTTWLTTALLLGLPMLAHASEVGHILDPLFSLFKMAVGLLAVLGLLVFLLVKAVRK